MVDGIFLIAWLAISIQLMVPIAITCFGELICEKSGTLNIGVEGCMLLGAFATAFTGIYTGSIIWGFFAGLGTGILCGLCLTLLYLIRNMDQIVSGLMLGSLGMFLSSAIKQLENFAGVMNFVIFPMFFASSALYPLWKIEETSEWLYVVCKFNPFTYAVETIRFSLYAEVNLENSLGIITCTIIFLTFSIIGYDPARRFIQKKGREL